METRDRAAVDPRGRPLFQPLLEGYQSLVSGQATAEADASSKVDGRVPRHLQGLELIRGALDWTCDTAT